jgi:hypothetical protein
MERKIIKEKGYCFIEMQSEYPFGGIKKSPAEN